MLRSLSPKWEKTGAVASLVQRWMELARAGGESIESAEFTALDQQLDELIYGLCMQMLDGGKYKQIGTDLYDYFPKGWLNGVKNGVLRGGHSFEQDHSTRAFLLIKIGYTIKSARREKNNIAKRESAMLNENEGDSSELRAQTNARLDEESLKLFLDFTGRVEWQEFLDSIRSDGRQTFLETIDAALVIFTGKKTKLELLRDKMEEAERHDNAALSRENNLFDQHCTRVRKRLRDWFVPYGKGEKTYPELSKEEVKAFLYAAGRII